MIIITEDGKASTNAPSSNCGATSGKPSRRVSSKRHSGDVASTATSRVASPTTRSETQSSQVKVEDHNDLDVVTPTQSERSSGGSKPGKVCHACTQGGNLNRVYHGLTFHHECVLHGIERKHYALKASMGPAAVRNDLKQMKDDTEK